jgi:lipid II:glycine glycyltransferase (peptidoglycan interpeptide bridge formation enzyme)
MIIREVREQEKELFNKAVSHPLQSWDWGEFRESTGVEVVRIGKFEEDELTEGFQITFHRIPYINKTIGYIPKSFIPQQEFFQALRDLAKKYDVIFYKLEPNKWHLAKETNNEKFEKLRLYISDQKCVPGKSLFTKYSFMMDLTKSEEELLTLMKPKTRYNTRLAQRKGVVVTEDNSDEAFEEYLDLTFKETVVRQGFYAHDKEYHKRMWNIMSKAGIAHLLKASYGGKTLVTWILFVFNGVLYYPYGASSSQNREVMASNLMMWEAIKFGKKMECKLFDMWGSLGPNPDPSDPWIGFHTFKEGYGPDLMEFVGTYDFVIDPALYSVYNVADNLRWKLLRLKTKFK